MWRNFTDTQSWKCMLGVASKEVKDHDDIYSWKVNKKNHLMFGRELIEDDLDYLKSFLPFGYYYAEESNVEFLKKHFNINKDKSYAAEIHLDYFDLSGAKYKNIRNSINKANRYGIEFEDNYRKIGDVKQIIDDWDNSMGDRKFRSFANKNIHFFGSNFHIGCINIFGYKDDKLVSFGVLSNREYSAYVIGKSLCLDYPGLSELTDYLLYKKAKAAGVKIVNLSGGTNKIMFYKKKFPGITTVLEFDGKVNNVI